MLSAMPLARDTVRFRPSTWRESPEREAVPAPALPPPSRISDRPAMSVAEAPRLALMTAGATGKGRREAGEAVWKQAWRVEHRTQRKGFLRAGGIGPSAHQKGLCWLVC